MCIINSTDLVFNSLCIEMCCKLVQICIWYDPESVFSSVFKCRFSIFFQDFAGNSFFFLRVIVF